MKDNDMDRVEHLQWCKDRAMEYLDHGNLQQAFASFNSDMAKHEETAKHSALKLGSMLFANGQLDTVAKMKKWMLGFNGEAMP